MYAYADQNFLISCADNRTWHNAVVAAINEGRVTLVLSPWHFYEIGNANRGRAERLVQFAEDINPAWIRERADIQLQEFLSVWIPLWGNYCPPFRPISTLAEAAAALHRTHLNRMTRFTVRDFVGAFTTESAQKIVRESLEEQGAVAASNLVHYQKGRFTPSLMKLIDLQHIAHQLARKDGLIEPEEVQRRATALLNTQPHATMIEVFIYWGGMNQLKTYQVEGVLTEQMYSTDAKLSVNRVVDRMHAIMALSHCDVFVTDDRDLIRRCEAARKEIPFPVAAVQTGGEFIQSLETKPS